MSQENAELIACCGLYCGECPSYTGKIADLARDLRKELRQARYARMAAALAETPFFAVFSDYDKCYEVLGAMVKMRCRHTCRGGGGPPFCKMRKCCQKKGIRGCWECGEFETCAHLNFLNGVHGDAHIKNLRILSRKGVDVFLAGKKYW